MAHTRGYNSTNPKCSHSRQKMTSNQHLRHLFPRLQLYEHILQVTVHASGEASPAFPKGYHPSATQRRATLFDDVRMLDLSP